MSANNDSVRILKVLKVLINELKQEPESLSSEESNVNDEIALTLKYLQLMNVLETNDKNAKTLNESRIEKYLEKLKENTLSKE